MSRWLRIFIVSVAVLLLATAVAVVAAFVYENGSWNVIRVPVLGASLSRPLGWIEYEVHLGALLVGCFAAGCVTVVALFLIPLSLRRGFERRRRERFIGALEGELSDLRNLPLTEPAPYEDIDEGEGEAGRATGLSSRDRHGRPSPTRGKLDDDDEALLLAALSEESRSPRPVAARGKR